MSATKIQEIGQAMNVYVLPPLPDFPLPPLPPISDKVLFQVCTTHASTYSLPKRTSDLDVDTAPIIEDYEKLEHVGDGLLGAVATVILHELYPNLREGPATSVKDHLVRNATLAQLADRYGLPDLLKASPEAMYATKAQVKTKGSLFESWVAGVYYSFIINGGDGETWPKRDVQAQPEEEMTEEQQEQPSPVSHDEPTESTVSADDSDIQVNAACPAEALDEPEIEEPSPTPTSSTTELIETAVDMFQISVVDPEPKETPASPDSSSTSTAKIESTPTSKTKTHGEAFQYIFNWLAPLLTPVAKFALQSMQAEQKRLFALGSDSTSEQVMTWQAEDRVSTGAKAALNIYASNKWGKEVRYTDVRAGEGLWKIICEVEDDQGKVWSGEGIRHTKKSAGALAAYKVCCQLKLLK